MAVKVTTCPWCNTAGWARRPRIRGGSARIAGGCKRPHWWGWCLQDTHPGFHAVMVKVTGRKLIEIAEVLHLPPIGHAGAIRVGPDGHRRAGDDAKRVAHDDAVIGKVGAGQIIEHQRIPGGARDRHSVGEPLIGQPETSGDHRK